MAITTTLKEGSSGDQVKELQSKLGVTADGIFGPKTAAAVRAYQQSNGLTVDAIVGPQTLSKLYPVVTPPVTTTPVVTQPTVTPPTPNQPVVTPPSISNPTPPPTPPTPSTPQPSVNYQQGSGSSDAPDATVKLAQQKLGITADGIFGPQTKSAVMAFQQANGLKVDGIIGPLTLAALNKQDTSTSGGITPQPDQNTIAKPHNDPSYKFDSLTGAPNPSYKDPQAEITDINAKAQADAEELAKKLSETNSGASIDTSASEKLIKSLEDLVTNKNTDTTQPKSLTQQLADKRAELGVDPLETQLNGIDSQIAKLDSDFSALSDTETNRQVSVLQINRRKSQEQTQYDKAKNDLILQRNSIANTLNSKYAVINTAMQYASQDYNNAEQDYTTRFNEAVSLINLAKGVEDSKKSDLEKTQDNAKANITLMIDALKGTDYSKVDPTTQASITKMELQAGLPSGFTKFAISSSDQPIVSIGSEFTDTNGNRQVPVYSKNPTTGLVTAKVITIGKDAQKATDTKKQQDADIQSAVSQLQTIVKTKGWYGVSPNDYDTFAKYLQDTYGTGAVAELKTAMNAVGLKVDIVGDNVGGNL